MKKQSTLKSKRDDALYARLTTRLHQKLDEVLPAVNNFSEEKDPKQLAYHFTWFNRT